MNETDMSAMISWVERLPSGWTFNLNYTGGKWSCGVLNDSGVVVVDTFGYDTAIEAMVKAWADYTGVKA